MTLLPRTLFGRNVLLILALIVFGQLTGALLFVQFVQKPRVEQLASIAVRQINSARTLLETVSGEQRTLLIARMNSVTTSGAPAVILTLQPPSVDRKQDTTYLSPRNFLMRKFVQLLADRLQQPIGDLRWSNDGTGALWVPIHIGDAAYWLNLRGIWAERDVGLAWLGLSLLTGVLAICGAYLIQRRINQPLHRLVAAATQLARGETPQPLAEDVPTEIATVSRSFNQMAASLDRMDRERAIMLAGVSHDLRTPLAKLRLGIEILRNDRETELIDNMTRSCEEMDAVIDQFLDYARAGSAEVPVPVDLNELVRECVLAYAANGQTLIAELGEIPLVPLRPQALQRLLTNLVENALRYGQPEFRIVTRVNGAQLQLSVIDHGTGIPAAELEAMKRPFKRGSAAHNGKAGVGLGLAIVERIAQLHGGSLQLRATDPSGLTVVVAIPLGS